MPDSEYPALNPPPNSGPAQHQSQRGVLNIPVPDPSVLTTQAVDREINHVKELMTSEINQLRASVTQSLVEKDLRDNQRFDAQSKALDAARIAADLAVQAALVAAEKAVTKAEVAAEKRYDTVSEKVDELKEATNTQFAAIQAQLSSMLGTGAGKAASWGYILAGITAIGAILGIVIVLSNVLTSK